MKRLLPHVAALIFFSLSYAQTARIALPQTGLYHDVRLTPAATSEAEMTTHLLVREDTPAARAQAQAAHRSYQADDAICDSSGFSFFAVNGLGVYDVGDSMPLVRNTVANAQFPCKAHIRLLKGSTTVFETDGSELEREITEPGDYHVEAFITAAENPRTWIVSEALHFIPPPTPEAPSAKDYSAVVDTAKGIDYTGGKPDDAEKHKLDVYSPKEKKNAPVLFFVHGGYWRSGDRALYPRLGNRFANDGLVVVIPSYRLLPKNAPPAQIEDVAAAFAWAVKNVERYGGDPKRIYIAGHSAGGHLVALLATNDKYLRKHDLSRADIAGVIALSGVYDTGVVPQIFGTSPEAIKESSPIAHVIAGLPPFLVTYCQWDYQTLPKQAIDFNDTLLRTGNSSKLVFVPAENHISEIANIAKEDDLTAQSILHFIH